MGGFAKTCGWIIGGIETSRIVGWIIGGVKHTSVNFFVLVAKSRCFDWYASTRFGSRGLECQSSVAPIIWWG